MTSRRAARLAVCAELTAPAPSQYTFENWQNIFFPAPIGTKDPMALPDKEYGPGLATTDDPSKRKDGRTEGEGLLL